MQVKVFYISPALYTAIGIETVAKLHICKFTNYILTTEVYELCDICYIMFSYLVFTLYLLAKIFQQKNFIKS